MTVRIPPLVTEGIHEIYQLGVYESVEGKPISDFGTGHFAFDNYVNSVYSSPNSSCYVGIDVGENTVVDVNKIRFIPNPQWHIAGEFLDGAIF